MRKDNRNNIQQTQQTTERDTQRLKVLPLSDFKISIKIFEEEKKSNTENFSREMKTICKKQKYKTILLGLTYIHYYI